MNATEEKAQQINGVRAEASSNRASSGVNESETNPKSGTPVTQRRSAPVPWEVVDKDGKIFASFGNWQQAHDWARWNMSGEQDSSADFEGQNGWDVRTAGCE